MGAFVLSGCQDIIPARSAWRALFRIGIGARRAKHAFDVGAQLAQNPFLRRQEAALCLRRLPGPEEDSSVHLTSVYQITYSGFLGPKVGKTAM